MDSSHPVRHTRHSGLLAGLLLWLLLGVVYALYLPGQHASLQFDDHPNLAGLAQVSDAQSALIFDAAGNAGALGRPLSMATFLLNVGDWPDNPAGLRSINVLIHLLNGVLVAWLALRLVRLAQPDSQGRGAGIAVSAAAIWMLLPILASTSLLIVQRMTSLSATFVLAGLLVYVIGRAWEARGRPAWGPGIQAAGILLGTLCATLAKENGVLLPLYALVLEATIMAGVATTTWVRRWRFALLALPLVALFAHLAANVSTEVYALRPYSLTERLLTQPIVLWDYVRLTLLPRANAFSPSNDDYPIAHALLDPPTALIAGTLWLALFALSVAGRKRWPLLALAVFWFLGGHSLESSFLPLEIYFEHRNYLPLVGPMLALSWVAWSAAGVWRYRGPALLAAYTLVLAAVLWQTTSLWGQPLLAAEIWAGEHPESTRAIQYVAQRYQVKGDSFSAHRLLARAAEDDPRRLDLALQALQISCETNHQSGIMTDLARVTASLSTGRNTTGVTTALANLQDYREAQRCSHLSADNLHAILDALLADPRYQDGRTQHQLHALKARLYREQNNFDGTVQQLMATYRALPNLDSAARLIETLMSGGLNDEAIAFITAEYEHAPHNAVLRDQWRQTLDELSSRIEQAKTNGAKH